MWKTLTAALLLCITACTVPVAHADGAAWVSGDWPGASALQARIQNQLRAGDGIVVHILTVEDLPIPPNATTITYTLGAPVSVVANDGWMNQVTADELQGRVANVASDPIDQVVMLIRSIHTWQDKNPRPIPPEPPTPPNYTWAWWAGGIVAALLLSLLITWRVRVKRRQYSDLASRADDPDYWAGVIKNLDKKVGES